MTTFHAIADISNVDVVEYSDDAAGLLERGEDRLYSMPRITLRPRIVISDESKVDKTLRLIDKAEQVCLINRSIASEVILEPTVVVATR
jgi:organic hydroperoxide reductase OsmC/OhrA